MKRAMVVLSVCAVAMALASCWQQPTSATPASTPEQPSSATTDPSSGPTYTIDKSGPIITNTSARYYLQAYTLTDDTHENSHVTIRFPHLISSNSDGVNETVQNYATGFLASLGGYPENYTNLTLTVDYNLTYNTNDWLSVSFNGYGDMVGAAHPSAILRTLNLNLKDGSAVQLGDIYDVNADFVRVFRAAFAAQVADRIGVITGAPSEQTNSMAKYLDLWNDPALIGFLNDSPCYMTHDKIGISLDVPHISGDHFETEIPYSDLAGNLKLAVPPFA